ncbi:MAG: hypothetical protein KJ964_01075, partial [Verrucomicrobia bacterium]|nr:hypothetical protein [Verrucomicrobiota bacterium]
TLYQSNSGRFEASSCKAAPRGLCFLSSAAQLRSPPFGLDLRGTHSVRKRRRRSWAACRFAALAWNEVQCFARRTRIRPKLTLLFRIPQAGTRIHHTVASGFAPRYARYIADAKINGFWFSNRTLTTAINTMFVSYDQQLVKITA